MKGFFYEDENGNVYARARYVVPIILSLIILCGLVEGGSLGF